MCRCKSEELFTREERASIQDAVDRGVRWLISRQGEDGSIRLEGEKPSRDPQSYYKVVWPLTLAGRLREANLTANYIKSDFMLSNGDFSGGEPRSSEEWFQWRYYTYLNVWIVLGAHKLGRFDLSIPGFSYMLKYRDPETGGFCNEKPYPEGNYIEDALSASYNGLACLNLGCIEEAEGAGNFLLRLLSVQPEPDERFYVALNAKKGLITEFPEEEAPYRVVEAKATQQYYYYLGYPIIFLSKLYLATNKRIYLEAAEKYFNFTKLCSKDVYASPPSGKLGWGCAALYSITGDRDVGEAVKSVVKYLLQTQEEEGCWARFPGFKRYLDGKPYPLTGRVDLTSEFTAWLMEILKDVG